MQQQYVSSKSLLRRKKQSKVLRKSLLRRSYNGYYRNDACTEIAEICFDSHRVYHYLSDTHKMENSMRMCYIDNIIKREMILAYTCTCANGIWAAACRVHTIILIYLYYTKRTDS